MRVVDVSRSIDAISINRSIDIARSIDRVDADSPRAIALFARSIDARVGGYMDVWDGEYGDHAPDRARQPDRARKIARALFAGFGRGGRWGVMTRRWGARTRSRSSSSSSSSIRVDSRRFASIRVAHAHASDWIRMRFVRRDVVRAFGVANDERARFRGS